jgi:CHAP domain-containing protein
VRVRRPATCSLRFTGGGKTRLGPYAVHITAYAAWTWIVPPNAGNRTWSASVTCLAGARRAQIATGVSTNGDSAAAGGVVLLGSVSVHATSSRPARAAGGLGSPADATSPTYPAAGAPCTVAPYATEGACPGGRWGYRQGGVWNVLSSRGFPYRSSVDFAAWATGLNWASFQFEGAGGTAVDWKAFASAAGMQLADTPSVGDIAWWGPSRSHPTGFVGVVVGVDADGVPAVQNFDIDGSGASGAQAVRADAYLHRAPLVAAAPPAWTPGTPGVAGPPPASRTGDVVPPTLPRSNLGFPSGMSTGTARVAWQPATDNVAVAGYLVWVDGVLLGSIAGTSYSLGGLACRVPHTFAVAAYDLAGNVTSQISIAGISLLGSQCIIRPLPFSQSERAVTRTLTYSDYHDFAGPGPVIEAGQAVEVDCKLTDSGTLWYRILTPPWGGAYSAQAAQFAESSGSGLRDC